MVECNTSHDCLPGQSAQLADVLQSVPVAGSAAIDTAMQQKHSSGRLQSWFRGGICIRLLLTWAACSAC